MTQPLPTRTRPDRPSRRPRPELRKPGFLDRVGMALDRAIGVVFPGSAARRANARFRTRELEAMVSYWDATDTGRLHGAKWLLSRLSPDSAMELEGVTLRDRSNQLFRTDGHYAGHVHRTAVQAINTGIIPQPAIEVNEAAGIDDDRADALNRQLKDLRRKMLRGVDVDGRKGMGRVQRLISRCLDKDGEAVVVFSDVEAEGRPLPLAVEVVSPSRLETPPEQAGNDRIRLGIERGGGRRPGTEDPRRRDQITHYWIRTQHPYDTKLTEIQYDRVPIERVRHLYEDFDADQSRGWPAGGTTADHSRDRHDFCEATLIAQQVKACHAGFRYTDVGASLKAAQDNDDGLTELEPGKISRLPLGEKIAFTDPPGSSGGDYDAYTMSLLAEEATAVGVPLEMYTGRYGEMNLSVYKGHRQAARMGWKLRLQQIGDDFLLPWWERLVSEAVLAGLIDVSADEFLSNRDAFCRVILVPPPQERLDEARESKAEIEQTQNRHAARSQVLHAHGADDEETQALIAEERIRDLETDAKVETYRRKLIAQGKLPPDPPPVQPPKPAARTAVTRFAVSGSSNGNGSPVHA